MSEGDPLWPRSAERVIRFPASPLSDNARLLLSLSLEERFYDVHHRLVEYGFLWRKSQRVSSLTILVDSSRKSENTSVSQKVCECVGDVLEFVSSCVFVTLMKARKSTVDWLVVREDE